MKEEPFRDGLRQYLSDHRFGNATWPDLIDILDARSDEDLAAWSRVWVDEPGRPHPFQRLYELSHECRPRKRSNRCRSNLRERHEKPFNAAVSWAGRMAAGAVGEGAAVACRDQSSTASTQLCRRGMAGP